VEEVLARGFNSRPVLLTYVALAVRVGMSNPNWSLGFRRGERYFLEAFQPMDDEAGD